MSGLPKSAASALAPPAADAGRPRAGAPSAARDARRLSPADALLLAAVITLVCLVSLPRIEDYARRTNERDARQTLEVLAQLAYPAPEQVDASADLPQRLADERRLRHRLGDARAVGTTDVLLHHGYYFAVDRSVRGEPRIVAWPRRAGRTGGPAYAWCFARGLLAHSNADGRFGGLGRRPGGEDRGGWTPVALE